MPDFLEANDQIDALLGVPQGPPIAAVADQLGRAHAQAHAQQMPRGTPERDYLEASRAVDSLVGKPEWADDRIPLEARAADFAQSRGSIAARKLGAKSSEEEWYQTAKEAEQRFPGIDTDKLRQTYLSAQAGTKSLDQIEKAREYYKTQDPEKDFGGKLGFVTERAVPVASSVFQSGKTNAYHDALDRIKSGTARPEDANVVAKYEDQQKRESQYGLGKQIAAGVLHVPAILGEAALGGALLRGAGLAPALNLGARAAPVAEASIPRWLAQKGFGIASQTALMPSMYLPQSAQAAVQNGGNWNDLKNLGPAYAMGMMQVGVLGAASSVGQSAGAAAQFPSLAAYGARGAFSRLFASVATGMSGQQVVDLTNGIITQAVPEWGHKGFGLMGDLLDSKVSSDQFIHHAAVQAATFAAFGVAHAFQNPVGDAQMKAQYAEARQLQARTMQSFSDYLGAMKRSGASQEAAGKEALEVHQWFMDRIKGEDAPKPDLTPQGEKYAADLGKTLDVEQLAKEQKVAQQAPPPDVIDGMARSKIPLESIPDPAVRAQVEARRAEMAGKAPQTAQDATSPPEAAKGPTPAEAPVEAKPAERWTRQEQQEAAKNLGLNQREFADWIRNNPKAAGDLEGAVVRQRNAPRGPQVVQPEPKPPEPEPARAAEGDTIHHIPDYKNPSQSVDTALTILGRKGSAPRPLETWDAGEGKGGKEGLDANFKKGHVSFDFDTRDFTGELTRGKEGYPQGRATSTDPLRYNPGLKGITYKGSEADPAFARLKEAVGEINAERADAKLMREYGKDGALKPVELTATEKAAPKLGARPPTPEPPTPEDAVTGYKTAKGSTYEVHEDGTTTRNKSDHSGLESGAHDKGDVGIKERSAKTVYVDPKTKAVLSTAGLSGLAKSPEGSYGRVILKGGKASLLTWNAKEGRWGRAPSGTDIPYSEKPAVGLQPLELWSPKSDIPGHEAYSGMHAGNEITEVTRGAKAEPPKLTDTEGQPPATAPEPKGPFQLAPEQNTEITDWVGRKPRALAERKAWNDEMKQWIKDNIPEEHQQALRESLNVTRTKAERATNPIPDDFQKLLDEHAQRFKAGSNRQLTPREQHILAERSRGSTFEEIAQDKETFGEKGEPVTRQRIEQVEQKALAKMDVDFDSMEAYLTREKPNQVGLDRVPPEAQQPGTDAWFTEQARERLTPQDFAELQKEFEENTKLAETDPEAAQRLMEQLQKEIEDHVLDRKQRGIGESPPLRLEPQPHLPEATTPAAPPVETTATARPPATEGQPPAPEGPPAGSGEARGDVVESKGREYFTDLKTRGAEALKKRFGGDTLTSGFDPAAVPELAMYLAGKIGEVGWDLAEFTKFAVARFGETVRPHLKDIWDRAQNLVKRADEPMGAKNSSVDAERAARGLPPVEKVARQSFEQIWDSVKARMQAEPDYAQKLIADYTKRPRAFESEADQAAILYERIRVQNEYDKLLHEYHDTPDEAARQQLKDRSAVLADQLQGIDVVLRNGGSATGGVLNARRMMANEDFTLARMTMEKEAALGKKLTPEQEAEVLKQWKKLQSLDETAGEEGGRAKQARGRQQWGEELAKDRWNQKPWLEKGADLLTRIRRAFVLSSPVVFAKLNSAAAFRMVFNLGEEGVGAALERAFPGLGAKAMVEGGLNVAAEARAWRTMFTKGMKDAVDVARTGKSELDVLHGAKADMPSSWLDLFGQLHGALKAPVKRAFFERGLEKGAAWAIRNGLDPNDPVVGARITTEAFKYAERSIFMQSNRVADLVERSAKYLERPDPLTGKVNPAGKMGAAAIRFALPVVKVPTNIVAETFVSAFGGITGSVSLARAYARGIESLQPEQADSIMRQLKKGSLGGAMLALGYALPGAFGGFHQPDEKRKAGDAGAGEMKVGDTVVPRYLLHNPLLEAAQFGATLRRVADTMTGPKKGPQEQEGTGMGVFRALTGLVEETPMAKETVDLSKAFGKDADVQQFAGKNIKSSLIPSGVDWAARNLDRPAINAPVVKRQTKTVGEELQSGIPWYRQGLKPKMGAKK